jgi:hypothetical protein
MLGINDSGFAESSGQVWSSVIDYLAFAAFTALLQ